jgi:hypothetical protein
VVVLFCDFAFDVANFLAFYIITSARIFSIVSNTWRFLGRPSLYLCAEKASDAPPAAEKSSRGLDHHKQLLKIILGVRLVDGMEVVRSHGQAVAA